MIKHNRYIKLIIVVIFITTMINSSYSQQNEYPNNKTNDHALVISGGGAKGAWGVGVVKRLTELNNSNYNLVVGTSTGTLIGPLALLGRFEKLEEAYTSITDDSILSDPENLQVLGAMLGGGRFNLKTINAIRKNFYRGYISNSKPLKSLISRFFTQEDYDSIKFGKTSTYKDLYVTSLNLRNGELRYSNIRNTRSKEEMDKWIWSSCNEPVYMSPLFMRASEYSDTTDIWVDGGIKENIPLNKMLQIILNNKSPAEYRAIRHIDVVIHNSDSLLNQNWELENTLGVLFRMIEILRSSVRENNLKLDMNTFLQNSNINPDSIKSDDTLFIRKIFMPNDLVDIFKFELNFNAKAMKEALRRGYNWETDPSVKIYKDAIPLNPFKKSLQASQLYHLGIDKIINGDLKSALDYMNKAEIKYPTIYNAFEIKNELNNNLTSEKSGYRKEDIAKKILLKYRFGLNDDEIKKLNEISKNQNEK